MTGRKVGLDVLRAGAICLVLLAHFAKGLDYVGIYGVELFFALSGFLIGGILCRRLMACDQWTLGEVKIFWLRRWWRTLPNYYLFLAVSVPFHLCYGGLPTLTGIAPFFIFSQNLFRLNSLFYGVSWSLCVEEWFYLLFPLCVFLFVSLRCSKRTALVCTTALFLTFPPLVREFLFATHDPATVRLTTIPRLDAIFYGVALAFLSVRHRTLSEWKGWLMGAAAIGLCILFVFQRRCFQAGNLVPFYRVALVALPLCFSLTLPFFAAVDRLPSPFGFLTRPVTNLSLWSYSIYLSHIPILTATYSIFGKAREQPSINLLSKLVGLAVCIGISKLIYTHFEVQLMMRRPAESHPAGPLVQTAATGRV